VLTERFKFISLLTLTLLSLIVVVVLAVAIDKPNESIRSVTQTCLFTWTVGVWAVAWRRWRRRRR